jgi:nitrous oxidase accessory protein NosD
MSISPVCAAPSSRIAPKVIRAVTNGFISLLILFVTASIASAATLVVPAGGDLQAAINSAAPGDTIVLEAGATYRGPFWLP